MQEALTVLFGIGVLTVATIALLNVACLRLHDVQKIDSDEAKDGRLVRFLYAYVYDSTPALMAREELRSLPAFLGWMGMGAILFMQVLYVVAPLTTSPNDQESIGVWDAITWASMTSYVTALLLVAAWVSNKVYGVLNEVNRD